MTILGCPCRLAISCVGQFFDCPAMPDGSIHLSNDLLQRRSACWSKNNEEVNSDIDFIPPWFSGKPSFPFSLGTQVCQISIIYLFPLYGSLNWLHHLFLVILVKCIFRKVELNSCTTVLIYPGRFVLAHSFNFGNFKVKLKVKIKS